MRVIAVAVFVGTATVAAVAQTQNQILALPCDQSAASPLDPTRPPGIAGVPADKVDPKSAIPACEVAASASPNDGRILYQLGRAYSAGKAYESSHRYYLKADELGHLLATHNLAGIYHEGLGVPKDVERGKQLLEKAANGGVPVSMYLLGVRHHKGHPGYSKNYERARWWYEAAAHGGYVEAMNELGVMLRLGEGGRKDNALAHSWYRRAAAGGNAWAMTNVGDDFRSGVGTKVDMVAARYWYLKGAEAGRLEAMYQYAYLLHDGKGGSKNLLEAQKWWKRAAEQGHVGSMTNYGATLVRGYGGVKDIAEAQRWYAKAAQLGDEQARKNFQQTERWLAGRSRNRHYNDPTDSAPSSGMPCSLNSLRPGC